MDGLIEWSLVYHKSEEHEPRLDRARAFLSGTLGGVVVASIFQDWEFRDSGEWAGWAVNYHHVSRGVRFDVLEDALDYVQEIASKSAKGVSDGD